MMNIYFRKMCAKSYGEMMFSQGKGKHMKRGLGCSMTMDQLTTVREFENISWMSDSNEWNSHLIVWSEHYGIIVSLG
jgi:hypothetical protein